MSAGNLASASTDELRFKLSQLRADKLLLTSQLSALQALPDLAPDPRSPLSVQNEELGRQLRTLEEKAILYRSSAWTCFELDLDVGRRARSARDSASADKDGDLALGIRLDTFWRGRFYEPYYLVFARPSQMLDSMPQLAATTAADVEAGSLADGLRLIRHTVPHFVPLGKLVEKYLPSVVGGEMSGGAGSKGRDNEAGGLTMLTQFQDLPGVHAFLSDLHCHLQAYVSRRQQAMALQQLKLPGSHEQAEAPALEALGTEAFDLVKVTWRIPASSNAAETEPDDVAEQDAANPIALALRTAAKRKRENPDDEPTHHLELVVQYHDLQSDRLVDETRPTGLLSTPPTSTDPSAEGALPGTRKTYGQVSVQMLEFAPELETRQRRAPGLTKADLKALRPEATRREDLEQIYAQERDGESMDMDEAFQRIAQRVWSQLRGKNTGVNQDEQTSRDAHASNLGVQRRLRRVLQPVIDPRLYRTKTPNFRELAAKYPDTFGKFVKDDGGYEAKIDFQDAEAVRCLAQTLLLDDFGIHATFSPSNLCPTVSAVLDPPQGMAAANPDFTADARRLNNREQIPNRLAYIALVHELLAWSLPTYHLLDRFKNPHSRTAVEVRGLDIGTGASAIYPILGTACFPTWTFVGTDVDAASLRYAATSVVGHANNGDSPSKRIALAPVDADASFLPPSEVADDSAVDFHFTMCNPPFYASYDEMDRSTNLKKTAASAICHGTPSEMVVAGGEVSFVERMVVESLATGRVVWWTCMLGKLSSVACVAARLKALHAEKHVGGWGASELRTGGGRTKRWVVFWSTMPLRAPDSLTRTELPSVLDKLRPPASERRGKPLTAGPGWTRKELFELIMAILGEVEGCFVYPEAYASMDCIGTVEVVVTHESWTRRARRAKLHAAHAAQGQASDATGEPLLMARINVHEAQESVARTGLVVGVSCTYGMDSVKFESFAMFLLAAVERRIAAYSCTDVA